MKATKLLFRWIICAILLIPISCENDQTNPLFTLSGTVTYPDYNGTATAAGGAIVLLSKTAESLEYDYSTVSDSEGNYSFSNLEAGTYYLNSNYYTNNENLNGRLEGLHFNAGDDKEITIVDADLTTNVTLTSLGQQISSPIVVSFDNARQGGTGTNSGEWLLDIYHTAVDFAFIFDQGNAEFTGEFGMINNLQIDLDPANLSSSSISAEVDLMSVHTGRRGGRDPLWEDIGSCPSPCFEYITLSESTIFTETNCIASTFGIYADTDLPSTVSDPQRYASFTSSAIEPYGDGFIASGNLTFSAEILEAPSNPYGITNNPNTSVTKPVKIIFKYIEGFETATKFLSSFEGKMVINAKTDFNIFSSHILDNAVNIYMNIQITKNK